MPALSFILEANKWQTRRSKVEQEGQLGCFFVFGMKNEAVCVVSVVRLDGSLLKDKNEQIKYLWRAEKCSWGRREERSDRQQSSVAGFGTRLTFNSACEIQCQSYGITHIT